MFDQTEFARETVQRLIKGATIDHVRQVESSTHRSLACSVSHPTRDLTPDSFLRAAKKLNMNSYGVRSATGRNHIVVYITINASSEMQIKNQNDGSLQVELTTKI